MVYNNRSHSQLDVIKRMLTMCALNFKPDTFHFIFIVSCFYSCLGTFLRWTEMETAFFMASVKLSSNDQTAATSGCYKLLTVLYSIRSSRNYKVNNTFSI